MKKSLLPLLLTIIALIFSPLMPLTIVVSIILVSTYTSKEYSYVFNKKESIRSISLALVIGLCINMISYFLPYSGFYPVFVHNIFTLIGIINLYIIFKYLMRNKKGCSCSCGCH